MTFNMPGVQPARTPEEIDSRFELWHTMTDEEYDALGQPSINDYLGWTVEEYSDWVEENLLPKE